MWAGDRVDDLLDQLEIEAHYGHTPSAPLAGRLADALSARVAQAEADRDMAIARVAELTDAVEAFRARLARADAVVRAFLG